MLEWLSYHRGDVAALLIIILFAALGWSVWVGVKTSRAQANDQVFGDPERTEGGWYWAVSGVSVLLLLWFYFSWGMARAYFPQAVGELCQLGKISEAFSPVTARLPIGDRYFKSTDLILRNSEQLNAIEASLPPGCLPPARIAELTRIIDQTRELIADVFRPGPARP